MRTICVIPARGGSERIPLKNIKPFHGRPIIEYSIESAQACGLFDQIIVSTDHDDIATIAIQAGADVYRREMDDGQRGTQDVAAEVLRSNPAGLVCVLYATAPLLTPGHILDGYQYLSSSRGLRYVYGANAATGMDVGAFYWGFAHSVLYGPVLNTGGDWVDCQVRLLLPTRYCCDINEPEDWTRAEEMYAVLHQAGT